MPLKNIYDILEGGTFLCGQLAIFATLPEELHTATGYVIILYCYVIELHHSLGSYMKLSKHHIDFSV